MDERRIIIIDGMYLCHRHKYAVQNAILEGNPNKIIYGIISTLLNIGNDLESNNIIFAWDGGNSKRESIYPKYKKQRKKKSEKDEKLNAIAFPYINKFRDKILGDLGFANSFRVFGYEADDIIASIVRDYSYAQGYEVVIVTGDQDMYQCLNDLTWMYDPYKKIGFTADNFRRKFGIPPIKWGMVKSIAGCSTDGVGGVAGVGDKTAINYLTGKLKKNGKVYKRIEGSKKLIYRNSNLVILPFDNELYFKLNENDFSFKKFVDACNKHEVGGILQEKNIRIFERSFCR